MDSQRNLLVIALLFISFIIWQAWQSDHAVKVTDQTVQNVMNDTNLDLNNHISLIKNQHQFITVKTDVLLLKINTFGGDIEQAFLLSYPDKLGSSKPFHLLCSSAKFNYQAQSGLIGKNGIDNFIINKRPHYTVIHDTYVMMDNQNELKVPLTYIAPDGSIYIKTFILKRGFFSLNINYYIRNSSKQPIELVLCGQLKQSINLPKHNNIYSNNFSLHSYRGAAYSTINNKYQKYSFKDIKKNDLCVITESGWVAMLQQYFATAWIPLTKGKSVFYTKNLNNNYAIIGFKSFPTIISCGNEKEFKSILWLGPEIQDKMAAIASHLDLTVDYGYLWFISQPLFKLLKFIYSYVRNWGFSIVIITFIVRGITYPLTKAQYISMAKMRMLQPKIAEIRDRLFNNKQQQSQEIIELYKKEKVNPLGGCLPLLIQMPVFLALYYMLSSSIELRHAPFIFWIHDLSAQDPYYILPIIMGITMFLIQNMSPATINDPIQKKIMSLTPIVFTLFFLWFPSGLVVYYIVSNIVTIIQQQLIYNSLEKNGFSKKAIKTNLNNNSN